MPEERRTIEILNPDERLIYSPEGYDGNIYYRRLTSEASDAISKRNTKTRWEQRQQVEKVDNVGVHRATMNYIVHDWDEGLVVLKGEPVPCTEEKITVGGVEFPHGTKVRLPQDIAVGLLRLSNAPAAEEAASADFFGERPETSSTEN